MEAMSEPTPPDGRRRTPAAQRAEEFLAKVLPEPPDETDPDELVARPLRGVDARTQARLEAMGGPDREAW
jgi:hypothetical protein